MEYLSSQSIPDSRQGNPEPMRVQTPSGDRVSSREVVIEDLDVRALPEVDGHPFAKRERKTDDLRTGWIGKNRVPRQARLGIIPEVLRTPKDLP
jgi:hypothetical protein